MTIEFILRMARRRPVGGVDTASVPIDARNVDEAVEAAARAMDAFLDGVPGVGVLADAVGVVWSERRGLPRPAPLALLQS